MTTLTYAPTRPTTGQIITEAMLAHLPEPVQRYMRYTGVLGQRWIDTVRIQYSGTFRTGPGKPWMPIKVMQYYTTQPAGFWWRARFKLFGLPMMNGSDVYKNGKSRMFGKVLNLFTVVDGQGPEVDQGTMIRYLQEMSWFPIGYLGENIAWQAVSEHTADATFTDAGKSVSGRFYFDDEGRLLTFIAQRYGDFPGGPVIRTWAAPTFEYGEAAGLRLPMAGVGVWQLPEGDFPYVNIRLTDVAYNVPIEAF